MFQRQGTIKQTITGIYCTGTVRVFIYIPVLDRYRYLLLLHALKLLDNVFRV
jgi:hypothetical protein